MSCVFTQLFRALHLHSCLSSPQKYIKICSCTKVTGSLLSFLFLPQRHCKDRPLMIFSSFRYIITARPPSHGLLRHVLFGTDLRFNFKLQVVFRTVTPALHRLNRPNPSNSTSSSLNCPILTTTPSITVPNPTVSDPHSDHTGEQH